MNIALQVSFAKIELPLDVTAAFVDQLAALQLPKYILALRIDEQRLDLIIQVDQRARVRLAIGQFGAVETLDVACPNAVDHGLRQAAFLRQPIKRLHDGVDGGSARGELGFAL